MQASELVGHELGFVDLVVGLEALDGLTHTGVGPQVLRFAAEVVGDDGVGGVEDGLRRAIVLLEEDDGGIGEGVFELEDVAHVGTTEAVHTLVVVAHHGDSSMLSGEAQHEFVLDAVGVLVLVDQQHGEPAAVVAEHVGVFAEQQGGVEQQVVEVHGAGLSETPLVLEVDVGDLAFEPGGSLVGVSLGTEALVLRRTDGTLHGPRSESLLIEAEISDDVAGETASIGLVIDGETRWKAEHRSLAAQDAHARRVERRHPHLVGDRADQRLHSLFHLIGGLVGEGDRQDLER